MTDSSAQARLLDEPTVGRFERHAMPNGDVVFYDPEPHRYYGEIYRNAKGDWSAKRSSSFIGCSTPGKTLDTNVDPLLHWAASLEREGIAQLAEHALEDGRGLAWLTSAESIKRALREDGLTWRDLRNAAATRGTNVHEAIFLALAENPDAPPSLSAVGPDERGYAQAAIRWWSDRCPVPVHAERVTAATDHRVAGRFDLLADVPGHGRVLVDAKTREKGHGRQGDHVQLEGYELCNRACGIGESDKRLALILTPWGDYREVWSAAVADDFLAALRAYRTGGDLTRRIREAEATK